MEEKDGRTLVKVDLVTEPTTLLALYRSAPATFTVEEMGEIFGLSRCTAYAVVKNGEVLAELPLPIAGLMSDKTYEEVREALLPLRQAAKSLGTVLQEPFLQVAFLPLPVIPHLKITDMGLVDVDKFSLI